MHVSHNLSFIRIKGQTSIIYVVSLIVQLDLEKKCFATDEIFYSDDTKCNSL